MKDFRERYPMDERAWSILLSAREPVQDLLVQDFKPRREGEGDYSALVISFMRSIELRVKSGGGTADRRDKDKEGEKNLALQDGNDGDRSDDERPRGEERADSEENGGGGGTPEQQRKPVAVALMPLRG